MTIRPTQQTSYDSVRRGLFRNFAELVRAQQQVSTGLRILRPSDDPVGTSQSLSLTRQIGDVGNFRTAISTARPSMDAGLAALDEAGNLYAEARELVMQGLNGTLNADDRRTIAQQVELLRERLIELGNAQLGERYLFGGTRGDAPPFVETQGPDGARVVYRGDPNERAVEIGNGITVGVNLAGEDVFARSQASGAVWGTLTGLAAGTTADEGSGFRYVTVRHDATTLPAALTSAGVASANGGTDDTLVGTRALVLDGAERTLQLGGGRVVHLPAAGAPDAAALADVTVTDEHGAVVHLDLSAWDGSSVSTSVSGSASVSLDGNDFVAVTLAEVDLELTDVTGAADGTTLHLDTRGLVRAGTELVSFGGTVNAFDVLQGIADDLRNVHDLDSTALQQRLSSRLGELDRNFDALQQAQGTLGARSARLGATETRLGDLDVALQGTRSDIEDADVTDVILEMTRTEQTLQLAQATGARLLQNTLLNYLG